MGFGVGGLQCWHTRNNNVNVIKTNGPLVVVKNRSWVLQMSADTFWFGAHPVVAVMPESFITVELMSLSQINLPMRSLLCKDDGHQDPSRDSLGVQR